MAKSYKRIAAVNKSMEIIDFLADQRGPVSGQQIAVAVNLPYNTTICHLVTLEDGQWIKNAGGIYELGSKFAYYWARYRARLKSQVNRLAQELNELEV